MKTFYWIAILCTCLLMWAAPTHAATPLNTIPSVSDPGLYQKYIQSTVPPLQPSEAVKSQITQPESPTPTAESKIKFKLTNVVIKGNTVFTTQELETIFKPSFNKMISISDLQNLVNEVTTKYRAAGYILSRAILPPQTISNGVVTVQVVEGYVSRIEIVGNPGRVERIINRYDQPILQSRPLQIRALEHSLLIMNDLPGTSVKAVLKPSPNIPASADLNLVTEQKRFGGYVSYDNFGSRFLGPQEIGAGVVANSLIPGSSDGIRVLTVPNTNEMQYFELNHTNPVGDYGTKFTFDTNYTNTKPGFTLDPFDVVGHSFISYVDLATPWIRSRAENFYVHSTFNYVNVTSNILGVPFYADLIRTLVFGGEYTSLDKWHGANDVRLDLEKGFNILGAVQHVNQSRPLGVPNFFKSTLYLSRLQALPWWQLSLFGAALGQYAFQPLLATEQYAYGGAEWGRGYPPSEIVGDDGLGMKIELRKDSTQSQKWLNSIQFYLFYDAGIIWNQDVNLPAKQSATSTGAGARLIFIPQLSANVYYAQPLTHSISTQVAMDKNPYAAAVFFQLVASV